MDKEIKILYILNRWNRRGAQQQLYNFTRIFPNNIKHYIFAFNDEAMFRPIYIENDEKSILKNCGYIGTVYVLFKIVTKKKYDIIVTVGLGSALFIGRLVALICGVRVIYSTLHTIDNLNRESDYYFELPNIILNYIISRIPHKLIKYRFLPNCKKIISKVSEYTYGYPTSVLYNGINIQEIDDIKSLPINNLLAGISTQLNGKKVIVQVGQLDKIKNQIFTIRSLNNIIKQVPNTVLVLVGIGNEHDVLKKTIEENKLINHVIFTGQLERREIIRLMICSDVLVLTSKTEALPNIVIEAQACYVPVVSFDVGAVSEIIINGETGYIVTEGDLSAFQECVIRILKDDSLAKAMGKKARKNITSQFTINQKLKEFASVVEKDLEEQKNI